MTETLKKHSKVLSGFSELGGRVRSWLRLPAAAQNVALHPDTLSELRKIDTEAEENGYDPCSKVAKENIERILRHISTSRRHRAMYYIVSPMPDGSVDIERRTEDNEGSVSVTCRDNGSATCIVCWRTHKERDAIFKCASIGSQFQDFCDGVLKQLDGLHRHDERLNQHKNQSAKTSIFCERKA